MSAINKDTLKYLAELARLELTEKEEEKLLHDLQSILAHFEELKALDTEGVPAMTGGTTLKNIFREDDERESTHRGAGVEQFPKHNRGFLEIPNVFE